MLDAVGNLPFQGLPGAGFHIIVRQQRFAFRPAFNPFK